MISHDHSRTPTLSGPGQTAIGTSSAMWEVLCSIMEEMIMILRERASSTEAMTTAMEREELLKDVVALERTIEIVREGLFEEAVYKIIKRHHCPRR